MLVKQIARLIEEKSLSVAVWVYTANSGLYKVQVSQFREDAISEWLADQKILKGVKNKSCLRDQKIFVLPNMYAL